MRKWREKKRVREREGERDERLETEIPSQKVRRERVLYSCMRVSEGRCVGKERESRW